MAVSTVLKLLVAQMPGPHGKDMYTQNIDKEAIEMAIAEIYEGGRENVLGLIEMLGSPVSEQDVKPSLRVALTGQLRSIMSKASCARSFRGRVGEEAVAALGTLLLDEQLVEPATTVPQCRPPNPVLVQS